MKLQAILGLSILSLILISQQGLANGGPVAWTQATPRGGISLRSSEIHLVSENLSIRMNDDFTTFKVEANYRLKNTSKETFCTLAFRRRFYTEILRLSVF